LIPVYLVLAFTLGAIVNSRWPRPAAALIVVALVVTSNAAAAELVLQWGGDRRYTSLQFGEARRVVERVPVGNMWSNHRAIERLNTLEGLYVAWALRCSEHRGPLVFAQQFPYRLVTEASETYGTPSINQWGLYQFGADAPRLWVAKIPESSAMSWWNALPSKTGDAARDVALLGPRIPRELAAVWHRQHVESSAARDAEDSIASRSCTPAVENALLR
jgi:hypothetical protein